jgi:predicted Zn-dependent peptidase
VSLRFAAAAMTAVLTIVPSVAFAAPDASPAPSAPSAAAPPTILRQLDDKAALVGVAFIVRAGLDRETLKQNGLAALVAQIILRTPVPMTATQTLPLEDAVAASGGSIRYTIDPDDVHFYVEALAADAPAVLTLVEHALAAPDFSAATLHGARMELARQINQTQQQALQVGLDMLNQASSTQANTGLPELGTTASLAQFFPSDAQTFYQTYYRRGGVMVSAVGRLDALPADALTNLANVLPEGTTSAVPVHVPELHGTTREIVAHRNIPTAWFIAQYPAPSVDSKDFGPMLVLAAFVRRTLADISQVPGVVTPTMASQSVGAVYTYDRAPSGLILYVNGPGDPSRAFATALSVVNLLAASKLHGSIDQFKAEAAGDFATGATTLETRAWLAAIFAQQSASSDFLGRTLAAIAATTPDDLQRVARTYLGNPTIALILPRGGNS